jgi:hypothetical protein
MRIESKSALILAITFAVGALVGVLGAGSFAYRPADRRPPEGRGGPPGERRPPSFVEDMEMVLGPLDSGQRARLRPYLEATDATNRRIVDGARMSMRTGMDSLRLKIAPMLDADQLRRFDDFAHGDSRRGGPPGLGGDGRRGGPPPSN